MLSLSPDTELLSKEVLNYQLPMKYENPFLGVQDNLWDQATEKYIECSVVDAFLSMCFHL